MTAEVGEQLLAAVEADPTLELIVDVDRRTLSAPAIGLEVDFPLDDSVRERFLEGLDDIGITLRTEDAITAFEAAAPRLARRRPSCQAQRSGSSGA